MGNGPDSGKLLLEEYLPHPELVVPEHPVAKAKFPAIDVHNHLGRWVGKGAEEVARRVEEMDACNLKACFDLDGSRGAPLGESIQLLKETYPGRFYVLTVLSWEEAAKSGKKVGETLARELAEAVEEGADGLKIHKSLGLRVRGLDGKLLMPDDPSLGPLFVKCAKLKVPCLFHVADPIAFFKPLDRYNERWEELANHPDWHFVGGDLPGFQMLMESQERLLEQHPDTLFQSAHVASASEDLGYVSTLLDRYPNLHVDMSARIAELGRQPYTAREFFLKYPDRILYGTDVALTAEWQRIYMRFLETFDEHFAYGLGEVPDQGRWRICGIGLPDEVLKKVYYENAERLYGPPA